MNLHREIMQATQLHPKSNTDKSTTSIISQDRSKQFTETIADFCHRRHHMYMWHAMNTGLPDEQLAPLLALCRR